MCGAATSQLEAGGTYNGFVNLALRVGLRNAGPSRGQPYQIGPNPTGGGKGYGPGRLCASSAFAGHRPLERFIQLMGRRVSSLASRLLPPIGAVGSLQSARSWESLQGVDPWRLTLT